MQRKLTVFLFFIILTLNGLSQIYDPVKWSFSYEKKGDKEYELIFTADIEEGSHIYSVEIPEGGPIPTSFTFNESKDYVLEGKPFEVTKAEEAMDEAFGMKIKSFERKAEFRQKIKAFSASFKVTGTVNYMACNNKTCSPPKDVDFEISVNDQPSAAGAITVPEEPVKQNKGILSFLLISLLAGFAGMLTPCVFPMIPMTVAFFSSGTQNRGKSITRALIFGLSIVLIYSSLGILVSLAGAGFANALSTHWIPNTIFFILFIVFAASFFGAFEIILPNTWVSKADAGVDRGGMLASFFLGLTTVIVSFSCTGPIVGALLIEAASGDILRPTIGMAAFGFAFALPFSIFALFPAVMSRMPKSGGWLNSVKVVLGFVMLAFSLKFLITIDSVYSLRLLSRDLVISIWIVLFFLLGLYLMGKIKFENDSEVKHIGIFRLFLIIAVFSFVIYLIPGLFGAPLKSLSSFLPSPGNSDFNIQDRISVNEAAPSQSSTAAPASVLCSRPMYADIFDMPYGLKGYFEYTQGLACAKEQGKPLLIDFKGHACANCKVMDAKVWSDPEVLQRLRDNFVIVALYVDDRTQLPETKWISSSVDGKLKKTIGKVNEDIEIMKFKTNALPLYVITDNEGNALNRPMPTNLNIEEYKAWLDEGYRRFKDSKIQ